MINVIHENFEELSSKLSGVKFSRAINKAFATGGLLVKKGVSVETPVRTGTLQRGWETKAGNMYYEIKNDTKYGPFVNNGTRFITANPFMQRGYEKVKARVRMIVFAELRKELTL